VKRLAMALTLALIAVAPRTFAQQDFETLKKGFQAERLYHFTDAGFDSVNIYNANLIIPMGIGLTYPLNGGFSYGISLTYNSTVWAQTEGPGGTVHAVPSLRANAGAGWLIGMGRYIAADDIFNETPNTARYEAPDGGEHSFDRLHTDDTNCGSLGCPTYTSDGSNLRRRKITASIVEVDAPDGVIRRFAKLGDEWQITQIRSANSNDTVTVSHFASVTSNVPCTAPANSYSLIHDSQNRDHYLCFRTDLTVDGYGPQTISEVVVPSVQGQTPARYKFSYHEAVVLKPADIDNDGSSSWSQEHDIPILDKLTLPDGSAYTFSNFDPVAGRDGGQLQSVTLPTGGRVSYLYSLIAIPSRDLCASAYGELAIGYGFASKTIGVVSRTFTPVVPANQTAVSQTWGYGDRTFLPSGGYTAVRNCNAGMNTTPSDVELFDEMVVNVIDPAGGQTKNHFSVWPGHDFGRTATNGGGSQDVSPAGFTRANYSFPYGVYDGSSLYLSQEIFDCAFACAKQREIWVRHDTDPPLGDDVPPHRLATQRTVFKDDCALPADCHWTQTASTGWDQYGHYRTVTTSSDFGGGGDLRTVTTSWNKLAGVARVIGKDSPWVLNTYEDSVTTEGGDTAVEQACFDPARGFLRARRVLSGPTPATTDLVSVFEKELNGSVVTGNVAAEKSFGGDLTPFPHTEAQLCSAVDAIGSSDVPAYSVTHTYQNGQLKTSQQAGIVFKSLDLAIDPSGLISASTDPTGRVTSYGYDSSGRLTTIAPPQVAPTTYTYTNATVATGHLTAPASVLEQTVSTQGAGTMKRQYQFDSLGRFWRERVWSPTGQWDTRETLYDVKNRKASVSAMERLQVPNGGSDIDVSPLLPRTLYKYDSIDRVTEVKAPDGTSRFFEYGGIRVRTAKAAVGTRAGSIFTDQREIYDGQGRLASVTEAADSFQEALTTYSYDVGNRLASVVMPSPSGTQQRTFTYDHRGLLLQEQHPELGVNGNGFTQYGEFDARGHAHRKTVGSSDLRLTFDGAERVTAITSVASNTLLKQFDYDGLDIVRYPQCAANNECLGKLMGTGGWNVDPTLGTVGVFEGYAYGGPGGRPSRRDTAVGGDTFAGLSFHHAQTYNDLGLVSTIVYPCHPTGSACPTSTDGPALSLSYTNGRLTAVGSGANVYASGLTYLPNGMVESVTYATTSGQASDVWTLDPSGMDRPLRIRATNVATGAELWSSGDYAYDGSGNVTRMGAMTFAYDLFGRLGSSFSDVTQSGSGYVYDRFGNRTATTFAFCKQNPDGSRRCGGTTSLGAPIAGTTNHYQNATYDDLGSVTSDHDGARTFAYDAFAMTTRAQTGGRDFHFLYNASDERVAVVERVNGVNRTTWSIRNFGNELLGVWSDDATSGTRSVTWKEDEIWRGSVLLANLTPGTTPKHYTVDHLGSPRLITDATGLHAQDFDPYGNGGLLGSGALQFAGQERDRANVGGGTADLTDYLHARSYDPVWGRFLSVDPSLDVRGSARIPQRWNRYDYGRNNPLKFVDDDGRAERIFIDNQTTGSTRASLDQHAVVIQVRAKYVRARVDVSVQMGRPAVRDVAKAHLAGDQVHVVRLVNNAAPTEPANAVTSIGHTGAGLPTEVHVNMLVANNPATPRDERATAIANAATHELGHEQGLSDNGNKPLDVMTSPRPIGSLAAPQQFNDLDARKLRKEE
jgi:RHS repeat-associated protein